MLYFQAGQKVTDVAFGLCTGVLQWAGRLFSLHESGLPYELNPESMSTLGETDLGGSIEGKVPICKLAFAAQEDRL